MYNTSNAEQFYASNLSINYVCYYQLNTNSSFSGYIVNFTDLSNANVSIYMNDTQGSITFKSSTSTMNNIEVSITDMATIYIVVVPSNNFASINFTVSVIQNESNSSSDGERTAAIVVSSIFCVGFALWLILLVLYWIGEIKERRQSIARVFRRIFRPQAYDDQSNTNLEPQAEDDWRNTNRNPEEQCFDDIGMCSNNQQNATSVCDFPEIPTHQKVDFDTAKQHKDPVHMVPTLDLHSDNHEKTNDQKVEETKI